MGTNVIPEKTLEKIRRAKNDSAERKIPSPMLIPAEGKWQYDAEGIPFSRIRVSLRSRDVFVPFLYYNSSLPMQGGNHTEWQFFNGEKLLTTQEAFVIFSKLGRAPRVTINGKDAGPGHVLLNSSLKLDPDEIDKTGFFSHFKWENVFKYIGNSEAKTEPLIKITLFLPKASGSKEFIKAYYEVRISKG